MPKHKNKGGNAKKKQNKNNPPKPPSKNKKKAAKHAQSQSKNTTNGRRTDTTTDLYTYASLAVLFALLGCVFTYADKIPSLTGDPSPNKPYSDFTSFYPFFLSQHTDINCQRCHIFGTFMVLIILLTQPKSIISVGVALSSAYLSFPLFRGLPNGIAEGLVFIGCGLTIAYLLGCIRKIALCLVMGYGCAWIGHFEFEKNRPATFIYPSFSLLGDGTLFVTFANEVITRKDFMTVWNQGITVPQYADLEEHDDIKVMNEEIPA